MGVSFRAMNYKRSANTTYVKLTPQYNLRRDTRWSPATEYCPRHGDMLPTFNSPIVFNNLY